MPEFKTVRLVFEMDQFFEQSKHGSIWGTIYFQIGDTEYFPGRGWTDLVGAFLRNWLGAIISIAHGTRKRQDAPFLDGPLTVCLSSQDRLLVELDFVHRGATKHSAIATTRELIQNAIAVAEELVMRCNQKGWANDDIAAVAELVEQGARALEQLGMRN